MPQQPPPQSPQPDQPTPPSSTPESTGGSPSQPTGRSTPPEGTPGPRGYVPQPGFVPGPTHMHGRVSTSGGYGPATHGSGQPPTPGAPVGWPAPGYGPAGPSAYPPGSTTGPMPPGRPAGPIHPTQAFAAPAAAVATSGANTVAAAPEPKKRDLTVNKVIAGAGAAATSAVLGSFFGAMGTVGGAALGSVFSAVVTSVMQHSLDKTRDTVKARVKLPGVGTVKVASTTEVPAPRATGDDATTRVFVTPGDQATEVISAVPAVDAGPPKSRRRLLVMTGFTVVVFAIGMLVITGLELVKGSPLNTSSSSSSTSQRSGGTSLGSVLGGSNSASTETSTKSTTTSETTSEEPTTEATKSKKSTDENGSAVPGTGFGADQQEPTSTRSTRATPTPTPTSGSGADDQSDQSDGGAVPQPGGGASAPADQQ